MKSIPSFLLRCSLAVCLPIGANAAGTYYTGNYQSPQQNYARPGYTQQQTNYIQDTTYSRTRNYSNAGYDGAYGRAGYVNKDARYYQQNRQPMYKNGGQKNQPQKTQSGFWLNAGLEHEVAMWRFEMKESASILHYDDISWNVFDVAGGYRFDLGGTAAQIDAGFKYGMQYGESSMVDDDITNGGFLVTEWWADTDSNGTPDTYIGDQIGHALSVGTSDGGSMMGFNIGFGLTDFFNVGGVRITPSIGYRYLKYELETKKNNGLSVDGGYCFSTAEGEIQCDPVLIVHYQNGTQSVLWNPSDSNNDGFWDLGTGADGVYSGGTYVYQQSGVSHSYEVEWSGPYVALDMAYDINQNNMVSGRVELGLPSYTATGDQPYRPDWKHPKSVEDSASIGSAWHFGLGANWLTAISDTVSLSLGLTYDYYSVSGADATTYLNAGYYNSQYQDILAQWTAAGYTENDMLGLGTVEGSAAAINIKQLQADCPGWVCKTDGEIDSFYRSLGIRVGINAKF